MQEKHGKRKDFRVSISEKMEADKKDPNHEYKCFWCGMKIKGYGNLIDHQDRHNRLTWEDLHTKMTI